MFVLFLSLGGVGGGVSSFGLGDCMYGASLCVCVCVFGCLGVGVFIVWVRNYVCVHLFCCGWEGGWRGGKLCFY